MNLLCRIGLSVALACAGVLAAHAQSSSSYQIRPGTLDSGIGGMSSSSYALGSASIGAAVFAGSGGQSTSTSYGLQQGFVEIVDMPIVKLSSTSLAFGNDPVGLPSGAETVTITNDGAAAMVFSGIAVSSGYTETNNCGSLLGAGASCTVSVTFDAPAPGVDPGTLSIGSDADGSPSTVALTGSGTIGDVPLPPWVLGLLMAAMGLALARSSRSLVGLRPRDIAALH